MTKRKPLFTEEEFEIFQNICWDYLDAMEIFDAMLKRGPKRKIDALFVEFKRRNAAAESSNGA